MKAVFNIPIDELRRIDASLKKRGDSAVIWGLWAPDDDTEPISTLLVVKRVKDGFWIAPMGVDSS